MTMTVKNNLSAINTLNQLDRNQSDLTKQLQKLSSGMNLNTAKDSPSAYAISERMRVQIRGLTQDISNAQNARALMNTAEGAVQSTIEILKTFKDKALDAANDTNTDTDRATIQRELDQLISQIDDNAYVTYNGKILLDGSMGGNIPADEQGVIVDFMSYLNNSHLSMQDALDGAINYASGGLFENEEDLKSKFLADMAGGDLLDMCGIDLDNLDTGSITGSDAGGEKEKTAESIVPEEGLPYGGVPAAGSTSTINGLTVKWPDCGTDAEKAAKEAIVSALSNQWLQNCMDLVTESYELNFMDPNTSVRTMDVTFENDSGNGRLAAVQYDAGGPNGRSSSLKLIVNLHYYGNLDMNDPNGKPLNGSGQPTLQAYLDRTLAHEMTHALMAANIDHFSDLPLYIKEGAAELVHGIDDNGNGGRKPTIENLVKAENRTDLENALNGKSAAGSEDPYAAGYMILRYMAHQAANAEPQKRLVFQIGTKANQAIKVGLADMRSEALGLKKNGKITCQVTTQKKATSALTTIDRALTKAIKQQTSIGAVQSRLEFTTENLTIAHENVTASESTIRDADMAKAFTDYTKANVLLQTAQSMLAQANQNSSSALSLLQ